jgi:hypothetical protein
MSNLKYVSVCACVFSTDMHTLCMRTNRSDNRLEPRFCKRENQVFLITRSRSGGSTAVLIRMQILLEYDAAATCLRLQGRPPKFRSSLLPPLSGYCGIMSDRATLEAGPRTPPPPSSCVRLLLCLAKRVRVQPCLKLSDPHRPDTNIPREL